jgi:hypothetical protein
VGATGIKEKNKRIKEEKEVTRISYRATTFHFNYNCLHLPTPTQAKFSLAFVETIDTSIKLASLQETTANC